MLRRRYSIETFQGPGSSQRLKGGLRQQAATADILTVIASSPSYVQLVINAIASKAKRLIGERYNFKKRLGSTQCLIRGPCGVRFIDTRQTGILSYEPGIGL